MFFSPACENIACTLYPMCLYVLYLTSFSIHDTFMILNVCTIFHISYYIFSCLPATRDENLCYYVTAEKYRFCSFLLCRHHRKYETYRTQLVCCSENNHKWSRSSCCSVIFSRTWILSKEDVTWHKPSTQTLYMTSIHLKDIDLSIRVLCSSTLKQTLMKMR